MDAIISTPRSKVADDKGAMSSWFPTGSSLPTVYDNCPKGSPLRQLMVDLHVKFGSEKWIKDDSTPHEFLLELSKALFNNRQTTPSAANKYSELTQGIPKSYYIASAADSNADAQS